MENFSGKKIMPLMKLAEAGSTSKKNIQEGLELEVNSCELTYDSVSSILVRLPIDALLRSLSVCKLWYNMIHNPVFILDHALLSEIVLLFQVSALKVDITDDFFVERSVTELTNFAKPPLVNNRALSPSAKSCIQFVEYVDGNVVTKNFNISFLGRVIASCNSLILIRYYSMALMKSIGMVVMNPVTRKSVFLRIGTLISQRNRHSYGFGYDPITKQYKVVHLFDDGSGYTNCEIIVVGARHWKMVDGPTFGLSWFGYIPISAIGALHWLPQKRNIECIVSMDITKERFQTIELPTIGGLRDRIAELGDMLCFSSYATTFSIEIWVLKSLSDNTWTRFHTVPTGYSVDLVPICGSRSGGQFIFNREEDGSIYMYDFGFEAMITLKMGNNDWLRRYSYYLPHVNSLVSWTG